ncbi:MAG: hypothetical protein HYY78_07975 [Betaproteobacteria bacterium]|nr:hypothetical protein [Betaproteobacteria bacterium]
MTTPDDPTEAAINAALADWRQGDCVLEGEHWFVHRTESVSEPSEAEPVSLLEVEVPGFVVVTQSCDIVRRYQDRPFVVVAPLAKVSDSDFPMVAKGYRPQFAAIPGLSTEKLVADLDRVMTVDKRVVATWQLVRGCRNDTEARDFAKAVARKHARFAFPNDFNEFATELTSRIKEKHEKASPEGAALRGLDEIRIRASPSWDADEVELMFWFIANPKDATEIRRSGVLATWEKRIPPKGRYKRVFSQIATYQELTAEDYLESDQLDLDYLSAGSE